MQNITIISFLVIYHRYHYIAYLYNIIISCYYQWGPMICCCCHAKTTQCHSIHHNKAHTDHMRYNKPVSILLSKSLNSSPNPYEQENPLVSSWYWAKLPAEILWERDIWPRFILYTISLYRIIINDLLLSYKDHTISFNSSQ